MNRSAGVEVAITGIRVVSLVYLPPNINHSAPDPDCDLDVIPNIGHAAEVEAALCNCLDFGSKNSALVIGRGDVLGSWLQPTM